MTKHRKDKGVVTASSLTAQNKSIERKVKQRKRMRMNISGTHRRSESYE